MMMKSGLDFYYFFEIERAPSELLLTGQANSAFLSDFFLRWAAVTLKGLVQFQNKNSRPLSTIIFNSKILVSRTEILVHLF